MMRHENVALKTSVKDVEYEPPLDMSFIRLLNAKEHTFVHVSINGDISIFIYIYVSIKLDSLYM